MYMQNYIETSRLYLRPVDQQVYRNSFETLNETELKYFFGISTDEELAVERSRAERGLTTVNMSFLVFHLLDKKDQRNIGWCGYHKWFPKHQRAEIGYVLGDESLRHTGLMTEALDAIINYGFTEMNLNRIEAGVGKENTPSLKLMERFGFVKEGILREHYMVGNTLEDTISFSLLKREYKGTENKT